MSSFVATLYFDNKINCQKGVGVLQFCTSSLQVCIAIMVPFPGSYAPAFIQTPLHKKKAYMHTYKQTKSKKYDFPPPFILKVWGGGLLPSTAHTMTSIVQVSQILRSSVAGSEIAIRSIHQGMVILNMNEPMIVNIWSWGKGWLRVHGVLISQILFFQSHSIFFQFPKFYLILSSSNFFFAPYIPHPNCFASYNPHPKSMPPPLKCIDKNTELHGEPKRGQSFILIKINAQLYIDINQQDDEKTTVIFRIQYRRKQMLVKLSLIASYR